jgi:hypothetical protein
MSEQTSTTSTENATEQGEAQGEATVDTSKVVLPEQYRASTLKDLSVDDRKARIAEMDADMLELAHKNAGSSEWSAKGRYEKNGSGENHRTWAAYTAVKGELLEALKAAKAATGKTVRASSKNGAVAKIATSAAERLNNALIAFVNSDEFTEEAKKSAFTGVAAYIGAADPKKPNEEAATVAAARAELAKIENPTIREAMAKALGLLSAKVPESKPLPEWGKLPQPAPAETPKTEPEEGADPNAEEAKGTETIVGETVASQIIKEHAAKK